MNTFNQETICRIKESIYNELNNESILMSKIYREQEIFPKKEFSTIKIDNIIKVDDNKIIAFVPVEEYGFYLTYLISLTTIPEVEFVDCMPGIIINYSIICDDINATLNTISLIPIKIIQKGEMLTKKLLAKNNHIELYNDIIPDYFSKKVEKLELFFYKNSNDLCQIMQKSGDRSIWIDVCYNYKYSLTDISVEFNNLPTLKDMNISFDFDIHAEGKFK